MSINKAALLSALTINAQQSQLAVGQEFQDNDAGQMMFLCGHRSVRDDRIGGCLGGSIQ